MAKYILQCDCKSEDFLYDIDREVFKCQECGCVYTEENAGSNLMETEGGCDE